MKKLSENQIKQLKGFKKALMHAMETLDGIINENLTEPELNDMLDMVKTITEFTSKEMSNIFESNKSPTERLIYHIIVECYKIEPSWKFICINEEQEALFIKMLSSVLLSIELDAIIKTYYGLNTKGMISIKERNKSAISNILKNAYYHLDQKIEWKKICPMYENLYKKKNRNIMTIDELDISKRLYHCLIQGNCYTINDIVEADKRNKLSKIGVSTYKELYNILASMGIQLKSVDDYKRQ